MKNGTRSYLWWPGFDKELEEVVATCSSCSPQCYRSESSCDDVRSSYAHLLRFFKERYQARQNKQLSTLPEGTVQMPNWLLGEITSGQGTSYEVTLDDGRTFRWHVDHLRFRQVVGRDITTAARMLQVSSGSAIFQCAKVRHASAQHAQESTPGATDRV
ncbi:hypothetical protein Pcinc_007790 [Petrolisthes cinctipes]|uniref:Uncharacterized protein n=1 Tax=Petrolisthes cinctipes TaxID=88211 RepID=A0AAE1GA68_PETCI|nr:hypothetical protein Pcinc_007790 [Petrolisthes cinctipes]